MTNSSFSSESHPGRASRHTPQNYGALATNRAPAATTAPHAPAGPGQIDYNLMRDDQLISFTIYTAGEVERIWATLIRRGLAGAVSVPAAAMAVTLEAAATASVALEAAQTAVVETDETTSVTEVVMAAHGGNTVATVAMAAAPAEVTTVPPAAAATLTVLQIATTDNTQSPSNAPQGAAPINEYEAARSALSRQNVLPSYPAQSVARSEPADFEECSTASGIYAGSLPDFRLSTARGPHQHVGGLQGPMFGAHVQRVEGESATTDLRPIFSSYRPYPPSNLDHRDYHGPQILQTQAYRHTRPASRGSRHYSAIRSTVAVPLADPFAPSMVTSILSTSPALPPMSASTANQAAFGPYSNPYDSGHHVQQQEMMGHFRSTRQISTHLTSQTRNQNQNWISPAFPHNMQAGQYDDHHDDSFTNRQL